MKTKYHYLVVIHSTTFEKDAHKTKPLSQEVIFKCEDLRIARKRAIAFYNEQLVGLRTASYVLPTAPVENFKMGKNSAISIDLSLVEEGEKYKEKYSLSDPDEIEETLEIEDMVFSELGISI